MIKKSYEKDIQEAAIDWHNILKGHLLSYKQLEFIAKYIGPGHWHKKKMKGMVKESFYGLDTLIKEWFLNEKPIVGICLGMQLFFETSEEGNINNGLGLLKGKIKVLKGCLYKHSGMYDSRNIFRRLVTKSYSKLRKRLYIKFL